jgi:hypothetical protein
MIEGHIRNDPVEPGIELSIAPESGQGVICPDQGILHDIVRCLLVLHETVGNVVGLPHVALDQTAKCVTVPVLRLTDQLLLVSSGHAGIPGLSGSVG